MQIILDKEEYLNLQANPLDKKLIREIKEILEKFEQNSGRLDKDENAGLMLKRLKSVLGRHDEESAKAKDEVF